MTGSGVDWNPVFVEAAGLRLRVGRRGAGRPLLLITGIGARVPRIYASVSARVPARALARGPAEAADA